MRKSWIAIAVLLALAVGCQKPKPTEPTGNLSGTTVKPAGNTAEPTAPPGGEKKAYVIGVSYQNLAFPYVAALQKAAQAEAQKLGVKLIETDAMNDTGKELDNVQRLLGQKIDCLAFEAASLNASRVSLEAAAKAGVPVVQFNGKADGGVFVTFVGSNQIQSGDLLGRWLIDFYQKSGKPRLRGIYLRGVAGQITDIARSDGLQLRLEQGGIADRIEFTEQFADYDRGKGQSVTESILSRDKKYDFIIANNDDMILGALQAVEQFQLGGKIALVGVDGLPETLAAIKAGKIAATVFQNPEGQGGGGIRACVDYLHGQTLPQEILIPFELVTAENVDMFIAIANRVYVK